VGTTYQINNHAFLPSEEVGIAPINLRGNVDLADIQSDFNAFYLGEADPAVLWANPPSGMPTSMTFAEWQAYGKDLNSQRFDPADPTVAANIASYRARGLVAIPSLILSPCCARFLMGDPNVFMQHVAYTIGLYGWSDAITYGSVTTQMFCGDCGRDGLLAVVP
jgi:hypothetical protein